MSVRDIPSHLLGALLLYQFKQSARMPHDLWLSLEVEAIHLDSIAPPLWCAACAAGLVLRFGTTSMVGGSELFHATHRDRLELKWTPTSSFATPMGIECDPSSTPAEPPRDALRFGRSLKTDKYCGFGVVPEVQHAGLYRARDGDRFIGAVHASGLSLQSGQTHHRHLCGVTAVGERAQIRTQR